VSLNLWLLLHDHKKPVIWFEGRCRIWVLHGTTVAMQGRSRASRETGSPHACLEYAPARRPTRPVRTHSLLGDFIGKRAAKPPHELETGLRETETFLRSLRESEPY